MIESDGINEEDLIRYLDQLADENPEWVERFKELALAVSILSGVREMTLEGLKHGAHPDAVIFSLTYAYLRMLQGQLDQLENERLVYWLNNITTLHTKILTLLTQHLRGRELTKNQQLLDLQQLYAQWKPLIEQALAQASAHSNDQKLETAGGIGISLEATAENLRQEGASYELLGTVFLNVLIQMMVFMGAPEPDLYFLMCQHWEELYETLSQELQTFLT